MFPLAASVTRRRLMTRSPAALRASLIARHIRMSSTTATESPVLFESNGHARRYILNRPNKLNALNEEMINLLHPTIKEWKHSDICHLVVGDGKGKAFCAGGDVEAVIKNAASKDTLPFAIGYFKKEFELDFELASLNTTKPYICILDGITMGGGVGLSAHAPFRVATENTVFAMPETKIGYVPDVGASYFLPKLDGEIGTYLALTSEVIRGRAVFENGLATHFIPSSRVAMLLHQLGDLVNPSKTTINTIIEELYQEPVSGEETNPLTGELRMALDTAFSNDTVEDILESLKTIERNKGGRIGNWAKTTREAMEFRSPTSLKIALRAIRLGKNMSLANALRMELGIATAFLTGASNDMMTGVTKVLMEKNRDERPPWSPRTVEEVSEEIVNRFFEGSEYLESAPKLDLEEFENSEHHVSPMEFALPTEEEIGKMVRGEHPQSGTLALTLDELISKFREMTNNKHGVETKIREVVSRRCEEMRGPDNGHYLRWK